MVTVRHMSKSQKHEDKENLRVYEGGRYQRAALFAYSLYLITLGDVCLLRP